MNDTPVFEYRYFQNYVNPFVFEFVEIHNLNQNDILIIAENQNRPYPVVVINLWPDRLPHLLDHHGWQRKQLAAHLKVTATTISNWSKGGTVSSGSVVELERLWSEVPEHIRADIDAPRDHLRNRLFAKLGDLTDSQVRKLLVQATEWQFKNTMSARQDDAIEALRAMGFTITPPSEDVVGTIGTAPKSRDMRDAATDVDGNSAGSSE